MTNKKPYNKGNFGENCMILYKEKFKIGKGSTYNSYCWFNARFGINIGENTLIGPHVLMHSGNHVIAPYDIEQNANGPGSWCENNPDKRIYGDKIIIGDDVWIGANVTILSGSIIPDKCVIGAGTIITKSNSKKLKKGDVAVNDVDLKILKNRQDIKW